MTARPLPENHPGGMRVMSRYCATCVFTSRSHVRPGPRFEALRREWNARDTHQTCTYPGLDGDSDRDDDEEPGLDGEDIVCHGFFREVFLPTGLGQMLRLAERLGGFEYVDPPA
jgi:hypothetical protein